MARKIFTGRSNYELRLKNQMMRFFEFKQCICQNTISYPESMINNENIYELKLRKYVQYNITVECIKTRIFAREVRKMLHSYNFNRSI